MKRLALVLTLLCLLAMGGQAFAELCTIDAVPAATLLLPYFEVDLDAAPNTGVTTLFSVNNASAAPTIAHVGVWTDWSQPVLDFDIFLTGYDVQSVNLYGVLVEGILPVTADEQSDLAGSPKAAERAADPTSSCDGTDDSCSPHGVNPEWDASFVNLVAPPPGVDDCINIFPFFINPLLVGARLDSIQAKLTGVEADGDLDGDIDGCYGADHGDVTRVARGYITIDNANACSLIFPSDPGYFDVNPDSRLASNVNQLWGDWFLVDPANNFAEGDNLVHIEAEDGFVGEPPSDYTFYRRYTSITGEEDNREPLGTTWGTRYLNGPPFDGTSLTVWRDATITNIDVANGFVCGGAGVLGTGPSWHPLNETQVVAFNEAESWELLCAPSTGDGGPPVSPPTVPPTEDPVCFPLETQRVPVDGDLGPTFNFGWMYLNLNVGIDTPRDGVGNDYDPFPPGFPDGTLAQSYVQANHSAQGKFSVGYPAIELTSACSEAAVRLFATP